MPARLHCLAGINCAVYCQAIDLWVNNSWSTIIPDSARQIAWDGPLMRLKADGVLIAAQSQSDKARLIAASAPHTQDDLAALPCSFVGTCMDDSFLRIAVALRSGLPVSTEHTCICGVVADAYGSYALSCNKTNGRHARHSSVNDLIKKTMAIADIPSRLEPTGLSRDNGKRPNGLTLMPCANGRSLSWDLTCSHTLATSNIDRAVRGPSTVACASEGRKISKYSNFLSSYTFIPISVETISAVGAKTMSFFIKLGRRVRFITNEKRSYYLLMQRLSQRGSATPKCGRRSWFIRATPCAL